MPKKKSIGDEHGRTRNWNFILYPESAPADWVELIDATHIEWVRSPLHDLDVNPENGEVKKEHYHITLLFPGPKTYEQVRELTQKVNAPIPEPCRSVKGSIRYMTHKDNPEKHQYDMTDIKCFGGADLDSLCAATTTERLAIQREIIAYIREAETIEFEDIVNYASDNDLTDWLNVLLNYSTISINAYLTSRRHKVERWGTAVFAEHKSDKPIVKLIKSEEKKGA